VIDTEPLTKLIASSDTTQNLRAYFNLDKPDALPPRYTGAWFERLGSGGDHADIASTVTAEDLIAVEMLSVQIPAPVAIDLLHGQLGRDLNALLADIPNTIALHGENAQQHIAPGSPAQAAWAKLNAQPAVGWVTAGKLLARKRPHLIPVYDTVVRCFVGAPADFWSSLHAALRADDTRLVHDLEALRTNAGISPTISIIRILDVAIWMHHHTDHRNGLCDNDRPVTTS
jgi:hypothetical protein